MQGGQASMEEPVLGVFQELTKIWREHLHATNVRKVNIPRQLVPWRVTSAWEANTWIHLAMMLRQTVKRVRPILATTL